MIGPLAAAPGGERREARRIRELVRPGRGAGGVERRVLHQPDQLLRRAGADRRHSFPHGGKGVGVLGQALGDAPFRAAGAD
jgi:hypothetical protein